jgi:uncharacterized SAM-binding protein YcdF (DUF218 family)
VLGIVLWRTRAGNILRATAAILLVVIGVLPTSWLLVTPLEQRFPIPESLDPVDGIVVLAGAENPELSEQYAQPQLNANADRLTTFLVLAHRFPAARLVHSGDTGLASQSDVARELLLGAGIDAARIVFERRSHITCESPGATRELVAVDPAERWLLVTSAMHMPRAVACFRAAGWEIIPYPTDFTVGRDGFSLSLDLVGNLGGFDAAVHEWLGLVYYRLRGFTRELWPQPR